MTQANPHGRNILTRQLKPLVLRTGVGKIRLHTFWHTYSTMLRSSGAGHQAASRNCSACKIQTTMNVYTHTVSDQKRAANR